MARNPKLETRPEQNGAEINLAPQRASLEAARGAITEVPARVGLPMDFVAVTMFASACIAGGARLGADRALARAEETTCATL